MLLKTRGKNLPPSSAKSSPVTKVKDSWKLHEASASTLCNLLEGVTKGGWKDLYPLVLAALHWEVDRAAGEQVAYGMLSEVEKDMTSTFDEHASVPVVEHGAKDPSGGSSSTNRTGNSDSDTTGSFYPPDVVSISSSDDGDDAFQTAGWPESIDSGTAMQSNGLQSTGTGHYWL
jgi:hypothetical protein